MIRSFLKFSLPALLTGVSFFCIHSLEAEAQSFEQWCQQKSNFPEATQRTIDELLLYAGTKDCTKANIRLNRETQISLLGKQIADVNPIASLSNLANLSLDDNQIRDIRPLAKLTNLWSLSLNFNQIRDITPLSNLNNLTQLFLTNNRIDDVEPLENLTNLKALFFREGNPVSSRCPLRNQYACKFTDPSPSIDVIRIYR
jgi:internalin A